MMNIDTSEGMEAAKVWLQSLLNCIKDGGDFAKGSTWLAYLNYTFTPKVSTVFRLSGESLSGKTKTIGSDALQYTVGPSLTVTPNLTVRAEFSYWDFSGNAKVTKPPLRRITPRMSCTRRCSPIN